MYNIEKLHGKKMLFPILVVVAAVLAAAVTIYFTGAINDGNVIEMYRLGNDKSGKYTIFTEGRGIFILQKKGTNQYFYVAGGQMPAFANAPFSNDGLKLRFHDYDYGGSSLADAFGNAVKLCEVNDRTVAAVLGDDKGLEKISFVVPNGIEARALTARKSISR